MEPINLKDLPQDEPETSRSADTVRLLPLYAAAHLGMTGASSSVPSSPHLSPPPSPHSGYPSPSSPSGESVSSLPSVSSSFLLSSVPGSPPHLGHGLHHDRPEHELGDSSLIIPSLTLPSAVRRPTPYGQTLGDVRLLVLGHAGSGAEGVAQVFADEECEDIVEVGQWEEFEADTDDQVRAKVLRLSTDWIEHRDAHGLEKHEPSRNVEVVLLQDYGPDDNPDALLRSVLAAVHAPFNSLATVLNPEQSPNGLLASLLASSSSPLYTAMVLIPSHQISPFEQRLVAELGTHIPLILLPSHQSSSTRSGPLRSFTHTQSPYSRRPSLQGLHNTDTSNHLRNVRLASIRPDSAHALKLALLHSPEALASLRLEAAERFMRWREVERAVGHVLGSSSPSSERDLLSNIDRTPVVTREDPSALERRRRRTHGPQRWDKARWEAEWEGALATDVAKTLRARRGKGMERRPTITAAKVSRPRQSPRMSADVGVGTSGSTHFEDPARSVPAYFDPLHLPSLLAFSISLLSPLKSKLTSFFSPFRTRHSDRVDARGAGAGGGRSSDKHPFSSGLGWAFVGAFCVGFGMGITLSRTL